MTVVYRHRRLDNNEVFYVGIGKKSRPYCKSNRNPFWFNIATKAGYSVEIIAEVEHRDDACELEKLLIVEYGRKDIKTGILSNMTDGGEGVTNRSNYALTRSPKAGRPKKPVVCYSKEGDFIGDYESIQDAERKTGVKKPHIIAVCKGRGKTAGGYIWKYKEIK